MPEEELDELFADLEALEDEVMDPEARERLEEAIEAAEEVQAEVEVLQTNRRKGTFGRIIRGFDRHDAAEAFLGALLFGIPMGVEGGTNEVGEFMTGHPILFVLSLVATVGLVVSILFVAKFQEVRVKDPVLGFIPRRLLGVLGISFGTSVALLTIWGRVDWLADPWLALCTCTVAFTPMAIGAALGDILPGS